VVDFHRASIARLHPVVGGDPVGFHDGATKGVDLRKANRITLQHLFARVATVAVDVQPVAKEPAVVSTRVFFLHADRLQNIACRQRVVGALYKEVRGPSICDSDNPGDRNERRNARYGDAKLHEEVVAPPMKVSRSSSSRMSMKMHSPGHTSAASTTDA